MVVFCFWRSGFCILKAAASKHILVNRISRRQDTEERKANGAIWGITGQGFIWRTTQQVEISDSGVGWGGGGLCGPTTITSFLCLRLDSLVSTVNKWPAAISAGVVMQHSLASQASHAAVCYLITCARAMAALIISALQSLLSVLPFPLPWPDASARIQHPTEATIKMLTKAWVNTQTPSRRVHVCFCLFVCLQIAMVNTVNMTSLKWFTPSQRNPFASDRRSRVQDAAACGIYCNWFVLS